jgi:hypothetical protein
MLKMCYYITFYNLCFFSVGFGFGFFVCVCIHGTPRHPLQWIGLQDKFCVTRHKDTSHGIYG